MKWMLLLVLIPAVSAVLDPCDNCPLPGPFLPRDNNLCQNQSDDSYTPTFVRYSLGTECYLQMMDCPYYEMTDDASCAPTAPPQQALQCFRGIFFVNGVEGTAAIGVERIRCNPLAAGNHFEMLVNCDDCLLPEILSETDTEFCGAVGSAGIQMTKTNNGSHCVLTLTGCDSYDVVAGYDGAGMCRSGENIVGVCVNGRFKLDGREIYKARCRSSTSLPEEECDKGGWMYSSVTDSYYKLGYNKTFEEAKAACIADGGQLASIHSQEENDFIVSMAWMLNPKASVGQGLHLLFGIDIENMTADNNGFYQYVDNTTIDYENWVFGYVHGTGWCFGLHTGEEVILPEYIPIVSITPGVWSLLDCSTADGYICKKPAKFKCTQCPSITQNITGSNDGTLSVSYGIAGSGCRTATFTCNSTIPDNRVRVWSGDGDYYSLRTECNSLVTWLYTCNEEGVWGIHYEGGLVPQPPTAICKNIGPCENSSTTTTTTPAPATACTSCPPLTQKPTDLVGAYDVTFSATYDSSTECTKASIKCTGSTPDIYVGLTSYESIAFGYGCGTVNYTDAYTCGNNGVWIDVAGREAASQVECIEVPGVAC